MTNKSDDGQDQNAPPVQDQMDDKTAEAVQQVYQYIYDIEEKRVDRKVRKVENIFEQNPLDFDEMMVDTKLERQRREKQYKHLYKSHTEIYEEEMVKTKAVRESLQRIIEKFQIDVEENQEMPNENRYRMDAR